MKQQEKKDITDMATKLMNMSDSSFEIIKVGINLLTAKEKIDSECLKNSQSLKTG